MESKNRYVYGSAAPQMPQEQNKPQRSSRQPVPGKTRVYTAIPKGKMVFAIMALFAMCFIIIYRFSAIAEYNFRMGTLQSQYDTLRDDIGKLKVDIGTNVNLENVRKIAEERLNMHKPDHYQIVSVSVPKNNYNVVIDQSYIDKTAKQNSSWLEQAVNAVRSIFP